ncbi:MAG TPA: hypothetical protein VD866_01725 [Urbifossiella sp.]|nr:hypothetical protein [Urbifossiella sp.]
MRTAPAAVLLAALAAAGCAKPTLPPPPPEPLRSDRLAEPVRLEIDGNPIDSGYPFLGDIDGDGRPELLMGGDADGRLLVYASVGPPTAPRLGAPQWFDDRNPTGRIPKG